MDESDSFHFFSLLLDTLTPAGQVSLLTYALEMGVLIVLLAASGLVSGSEVAFFSIPDNELEACRESKSRRDQRLASLCDDKNTLLATILVLNNLINVAIVVLSTYITWQLYGREEQGWAVAVLTFLVTTAIVFFGEVVPKVFAQERSLSFARFTTTGLFFSQKILRPLTFFLTAIGGWIRHRFSSPRNIPSITINQLNQVLEMTLEQTGQEPETQQILRGILNFGNTNARQIMQPRPDIIAADEADNFSELLELVTQHGYSRIPTYRESIDNITGILYVKDLLNHLNEPPEFAWNALIRRGGYLIHVSDNMRINNLFRLFQEQKVHMAIVTDEYAATRGLITLEDVIEEIVGDIEDEFDEGPEKNTLYRKLDEQSYLFDAKISIHDFSKLMEIPADYFDNVKGESESLGGLLLELFQKIPKVGEQRDYREFSFSIRSTDKRRIRLIKVVRQASQSAEEGT